MKRIGAVDIGGSKVAVATVSDDGAVLARRQFPTEPERGPAHTLTRIEHTLHEWIEQDGALEGIGIGCPGPIDPFSGTVLDVGTLPGWAGTSLAKELQSTFGVSVAMENDADAAALAEFHWGGASSTKSFLYITISTGIGGGVVLDGKLYRGVQGAHPELGHQVIDPSGPLCYCRARGCWESLASGTAMSAWMQTIAPEAEPLSAAVICERARAGDVLARKAVRRHGYYLGLGLANLVTLFAPEKIVLGGGVMQSGDLFMDEVRDMIAAISTQVPAAKVEMTSAALGADAGVLGAAQAWLQRFG